jgi:hypothetical protein
MISRRFRQRLSEDVKFKKSVEMTAEGQPFGEPAMAKLWSALFASKRRNRRTTYLSIAASP